MNPFVLNTTSRIKSWRELRESLNGLSIEEIVNEVNDFWFQAPIVKQFLDIDRPDHWGTPWEILEENVFDSPSRAILIADTLILSNLGLTVEMQYIKDVLIEDILMIVIVNSKYVLNYEYKKIHLLDDIRDNFSIYSRYHKVDSNWQKF